MGLRSYHNENLERKQGNKSQDKREVFFFTEMQMQDIAVLSNLEDKSGVMLSR